MTWKEIVEYSCLAEFDLLRLSRADIRQGKWSQPAHREGTVKYFKLCRAREEIARLNVEICRLRTSIHDETQNVEQVISSLGRTDPPLCREVQLRWKLRQGVNWQLLQQLDRVELLSGFTGRRGFVGVRLGGRGTQAAPTPMPLGGSTNVTKIISDEDDVAVSGEEYDGNVENLVEFMHSIVD